MINYNKLSKAVRLALICGASSVTLLATSPLYAQEEQAEESVERIEITGSRIKRTEMEGANPVQVLTRADLVASGISNIGDILQEIPSVAGSGENTAVNNGGTGAVRVSLRGLAPSRTLVLLNGRRMAASGTGANSSVDLSSIPTAIIKRVEVLKDGASAVYGSDAVAGVVNIITRDDFEGAEFNASYGASTAERDGEITTLDLTVGMAGDKGNVTMSAYYSDEGAQFSRDRSWSKYPLFFDEDSLTFERTGSSATPWGRYRGYEGEYEGEACSEFTHGAAQGAGQSDPTDFVDPDGYKCWQWPDDSYNYNGETNHISPSERYGIFASGNYEINDNAQVFAEVSYNRRTTTLKLAPLHLAPLAFQDKDNSSYSKDNYYNQAFGPKNADGSTIDIHDWRRRIMEVGSRDRMHRLDAFRTVIGLKGAITDSWDYEISYNYGSSNGSEVRTGGVNFDKLSLAVGPSYLEQAAGQVVCGTPDAPIADCVSLNTFGIPFSPTGITPEMAEYITYEAHNMGYNEQQVLSAHVMGDAFELPAGTVGVAAGAEYRIEKGGYSPDALNGLGVTSTNGGDPLDGEYSVYEAYVEANIPLLQGVVGAELLEVDVATRYSHYDSFGDTTNSKIGLRWAPIEGLMIRGTVSTAFRAPSTANLFAGQNSSVPEIEDPCAENPTSFCIADGVPAEGFEPLGSQLKVTSGGNPDLQPETSDITTLGVVYSPSFIDGLSITVDFWDITLENSIGSIGSQLILDKCAASGLYCDLIQRHGSGPLYGNSSNIMDTTVNVGAIDSSGTDFNVQYSTDIGLGMLSVNWDTTHYATYDIHNADESITKNAGFFRYGDGDGNFPTIKSNLNVRIQADDWDAAWSMRYIGAVEEEYDDDLYRDVDAITYHDLTFTYHFDTVRTTFALKNVLDEEPPLLAGAFNDNTDPRTYNTRGRHFYLGVGVSF